MLQGEKLRQRMCRAFPYLVMLAAYLVSVVFWGLYGSHNINADDASEMILATLLNEEGVFLSPNWLYSTELRVISPVPLYQLGLKLFASWHAARTFAVAIVMAGVMASALFMMRSLRLERSAPWFAAALMIPFSGTYAYIIMFSCYYAVHLMLSFVMLGLIARYGRAGLKGGKASIGLLAALGLFSGLGGIRMLTMFVAPVAAATLVMAVVAAKDVERMRDAAHMPAARMCGASMFALLLAGAGYVINEKVIAQRYIYAVYNDQQIGPFAFSDVWDQFDRLVRDLGYRRGELFFSIGGINSLLALMVGALMLLAVVRLLARWGTLKAEHRLLLLTGMAAVALGMLLNVLLHMEITRYFIVGTLLLIALVFAEIETELGKNAALRACAACLLVGCFAFMGQYMLRYQYKQGDVNYEMAADWLIENGYTQGYATFWNANTLTEASDGQIEMWVIEDSRKKEWVNLSLHKTLQRKAHMEQAPQGKVFLLITEDEYKSVKGRNLPLFDRAYLAQEDMVAWTYYVYAYDSAEQMHALAMQGEMQ